MTKQDNFAIYGTIGRDVIAPREFYAHINHLIYRMKKKYPKDVVDKKIASMKDTYTYQLYSQLTQATNGIDGMILPYAPIKSRL